MSDEKTSSCTDCALTGCLFQGKGHPDFCVCDEVDDADREAVMSLYEDPENAKIMKVASDIEYEFYGHYNRVQELIEFAHRMGFRRIGIATCAGLAKESRVLAKLLERAGFEVFGVACKVSETKKVDLALPEEHNKYGVNVCNPIMQARLLDDAGTELNVVVGLCMGHDVLFNKYSHTLTTTLVVKDRATGHNPCVVLNMSDGFFRRGFDAQIEEMQK